MGETKQLVCINCPMGCRLEVQMEDSAVQSVTGNICPRGEQFARQEAVDPLRVLTSLMRIEGRENPFSVKTSAPVPKRILFDCVHQIFANPVSPSRLPIHAGDVMIADVCGSGVDIISTQEILE